MEPDVGFIGYKISPGKSQAVIPDYDEDYFETVHLTQVALGDKPAKGPHTVFIEDQGEKIAIGTLDKDKCPHFSIDITLASDGVAVSHTGQSEVYISGYRTLAVLGMDAPSSYEGTTDEEESSLETGSSEDDEPPVAIPLSALNGKRALLVADQAEESSQEEGSSEEEESDSDSEGGAPAAALAMDSSDDEDGSEEEEEDSEEGDSDSGLAAGADSAEDSPLPARKRPAVAAKTPQPVKKARPEAAAKAPASAPAKIAQSKGGVSGEKDFETALRAFLQQNGPSSLAVLGSKVKRPDNMKMKLKAFLEQRKGSFAVDPTTGTVSVA